MALAVFGLAVMALLRLTGESTRSAAAVEGRMLAEVVADNRAVEAMLASAPLPDRGEERAGDRAWRWTRTATPAGEGLTRIEIAVEPAGDGLGRADLTVFRGAA